MNEIQKQQQIKSKAVEPFKDLEYFENKILQIMTKAINTMSLDSEGRIKPNIKNMRIALGARKEVRRLFKQSKYVDTVKNYINSFDKIADSIKTHVENAVEI